MIAVRTVLPNLAGSPWLMAKPVQRVLAVLADGGAEGRVVGGAVRNALLGLPVHEVDVATTALPDQVMALARKARLRAVPTGIDHGTVTVVVGGHPVEVTTLRRDVETDGRRAVVAYTTDWHEDAERRDFTINALYCAADGRLFDPVSGYQDLRERRVRFIGDATMRIREDYLRILRFYRFHATLGEGPLDVDSHAAAVVLKDGLSGLSRERVRAELLRLLAGRRAVPVVREMAEDSIFAALGLEPLDVGRFSRLVAIERALERAADPVLRLAALALCETSDATGLTERLRLSNAERDRIDAMHRGAAPEPDWDARALRVAAYHIGSDALVDRALIAWSASEAAPEDSDWGRVVRLADIRNLPVFPVKGGDLLAQGVPPGREVGHLLKRLEAHWIAEDFKLGRSELLEYAQSLTAG